MNIKFKPIYLLVLAPILLTSCEYGRKAEEQLNRFNSHAEELDSMVNEGIEDLSNLDSLLPETNKRLKKADSIIKNTSSTMDSLNQKVKEIKNLFE